MTKTHIDYSAESTARLAGIDLNGGSSADNLTVLDQFAIAALLVERGIRPNADVVDVAMAAWDLAQAMMHERKRRKL